MAGTAIQEKSRFILPLYGYMPFAIYTQRLQSAFVLQSDNLYGYLIIFVMKFAIDVVTVTDYISKKTIY